MASKVHPQDASLLDPGTRRVHFEFIIRVASEGNVGKPVALPYRSPIHNRVQNLPVTTAATWTLDANQALEPVAKLWPSALHALGDAPTILEIAVRVDHNLRRQWCKDWPVLLEGEHFGKYRIISLLGRGGTGVVYVAEDETLGRCVALKVLDRSLMRLGSLEDILRREARLIASLEHPHIVQIHSLERVEEDLAIDMAYMRGGSLAGLLRSGKLPPTRAVVTALEILSALALCHASGIVHRDVKPANILLDDFGHARLSDFGLAQLLAIRNAELLSASASSEFFVGTPRYAPPESWEPSDPTPSWDVYSMGIVLHESITGEAPFEARSPLEFLKKLMENPVPRLDTRSDAVSRELSDAVASMIERDASARPKHASAALELLRATPEYLEAQDQNELTIKTSKVPARRRSWSSLRFDMLSRKRTRTRLAALAVLIASMVVAAGIIKMDKVEPRGVNTMDKGRVFDTLDIANGKLWPNHLLATQGDSEGSVVLVAAESTRLWHLIGRPVDAQTIGYVGNWAEYGDASIRVFRYGTIRGTGHREPNGSEVLSLAFSSAQDGSRLDSAFHISPSDSCTADAFLKQFRQNAYVQPLVYNELVPRQMLWARDMEKRFLSSREGVLEVPVVSTGAIRVDGVLDDPSWSSSGVIALDNVLDAAEVPCQIQLCHDASSLFIGLRCEGLGATAEVSLSLLTRFKVPMSLSPQWQARFDKNGLRSASATNSPVQPWDCAWESVTRDGAMEIRIPFSSVDRSKGPQVEDRFRLRCLIDDPTTHRQLAGWGCDAEGAESGMVLVFAAQEPGR